MIAQGYEPGGQVYVGGEPLTPFPRIDGLNPQGLSLKVGGDGLVRGVGLAGIKDDSAKASRPELLPPEALEEISKVLAFGAKKYAENNWRGGFKWTRVLGATFRHLYAWARGIDKDPETGLSHLAHAGCNVLFLLTFEVTKTGQDDRHKYG